MSVQSSAAHPPARSFGAAMLGLLTTLVLFAASMLAFLVAPVLVLGVALLAYLALRPRRDRTASPGTRTPSGAPPHEFGAGAR